MVPRSPKPGTCSNMGHFSVEITWPPWVTSQRQSTASMAMSGFVRYAWKGSGTLACFIRTVSLVQLSGRDRRKPNMTGTSPEAKVTKTSIWQFAFLPSTVAYWGATPTEALPFLGRAVSSMISQPLSPPTNSSACRHNVTSSGPLSQIPAPMK